MVVWGINALNHGSSLSIFVDDKLLDFFVCREDVISKEIFCSALKHGTPYKIYWYENPWLKKTRQLYAGQYKDFFDHKVLPNFYLKQNNIFYKQLIYTPHHASHAAAGYFTSEFKESAVVVIDAIGEWESMSIWKASGNKLIKMWSKSYPNSIGLFYSAFTKFIGFKPVEEEYKLQQISVNGNKERYFKIVNNYFNDNCETTINLHRGVLDSNIIINNDQDRYDVAASVQEVFELQIDKIMKKAKVLTKSDNLVYMGGCSLNSLCNNKIKNLWNNTWTLSSPGDYSSSIGAVLYHTKQRVDLRGVNITGKNI